MLAMVAFQAAVGYFHFEPLLYLEVYVALAGAAGGRAGAVIVGVHALVNQKFVGHLIIIAYFVGLQVMSTLGFDHRLYQLGRPSDFTYSDMNGWGPYLPRIVTQQGYYVGVLAPALRAGLTCSWCAAPMPTGRSGAGSRACAGRGGGFVATALFGAARARARRRFLLECQCRSTTYTEVRKSPRRR